MELNNNKLHTILSINIHILTKVTFQCLQVQRCNNCFTVLNFIHVTFRYIWFLWNLAQISVMNLMIFISEMARITAMINIIQDFFCKITFYINPPPMSLPWAKFLGIFQQQVHYEKYPILYNLCNIIRSTSRDSIFTTERIKTEEFQRCWENLINFCKKKKHLFKEMVYFF